MIDNQPDIRPVKESGMLYVLCANFEYSYNNVKIIVPKGFRLDGASVPKILWWFLPRDGVHRASVLIHDWIYHNQGKFPDGSIYTRKMADDLLLKMMTDYAVSSWRSKVTYRTVRIAGHFYWNK